METTLGDVREEIARAELASENPIPAGMSKADYAERRFEDALVEDDDFDLLVMGRTQGKGCYCIRVHITFFNKLCNTTYSLYTSSGTVTDQNRCLHGRKYSPADVLHTSFVINYDIRIIILVFGKLGLKKSIYKTVGLIINRAPGGKLNDGIKEEIEKQGLHLLGVVPQDETVYEYDCEGKPTAGLPEDNPVKMALREIVDKLVL